MPWIDNFLDAFKKAVTNSGEGAWFPFSDYRLYPLLADLDIKRWHRVAKTIASKNIKPVKLVEAINGPLVARLELHLLLHAFKTSGQWGGAVSKEVTDWLHELLLNRTTGEDPYGLYSAKIHDVDEVEKMIKEIPWNKITELKQARSIGNLIMAAIHTAYAYYADYCYCQWFEVLGPYGLDNGRQLLLRRFNNFHPQEVWPEGPFPSFKSMDIFTIYKNADIIVDQWSHISSQANLAEKLESAAVLVYGDWAVPEEWPRLAEELGKAAASIQNQWREFDFEKTKVKVLLARWYQFSNLFNILGLDWRPTQEMYERLRGRDLLPEITPEFNAAEEAKEWWKNFIDPRHQKNLPPSYQRPWEEKYKF